MSLATNILCNGFLPRELPPTFSAKEFAGFVERDVDVSDGQILERQVSTRPIRHNLARPGGLRRTLTVPNPRDYCYLASTIEANWIEIDKMLNSSLISASTPVAGVGGRAFGTTGPTSSERRALCRAGARYLLVADIQQFYPSVYTHSIPWAIHSKGRAKAERHDKTLLGNQLDLIVRRGQDDQTLGLPIGPDASWLIAECLLSSVDTELCSHLNSASGYRYLDDYEWAFGSLREAESALGLLQEVLASYELSLNPLKTKMVELPEPIEDPGIAGLRRFELRRERRRQGRSVQAYFDLLAEIVRLNRGGHSASYAIARLRSVDWSEDCSALIEAYLLQFLVSEPSCAQQVALTMSQLVLAGHSPSVHGWSDALTQIAMRHAPLGHGSEIAWTLWFCLANKIAMSSEAAMSISKIDDPLVALLALHARSEGLAPCSLDDQRWKAAVEASDLEGGYWMLALESRRREWLGKVDLSSSGDMCEFMLNLEKARIGFYETEGARPAAAAAQAKATMEGSSY